MKMNEIITLLEARQLCGDPQPELDFTNAFASDMMSDVLAYGQGQALLLTGLLNQQVIRTAEMLDIHCVVFARGKIPPDAVLEEARDLGIVVLCTQHTNFTTCGLLYQAGIRGTDVRTGAK